MPHGTYQCFSCTVVSFRPVLHACGTEQKGKSLNRLGKQELAGLEGCSSPSLQYRQVTLFDNGKCLEDDLST